MKKLKQRLIKSKFLLMETSHIFYIYIKKLHPVVRYVVSIFLFLLWILFLSNPLLPGWLLITVAVWILLPWIQYKYIWRHFKSKNMKYIEKNIAKSIENIFKTNPKRYYKYKSKIKKIWKWFK